MNFIVIIFPLTWKLSISRCGSFQGTICCSGFFWSKEKSTCEKCPSGYYRSNCSEVCPFPSFGDDCQNICNCHLSLCDYRFGCKKERSEGTSKNGSAYLVHHTSEKLYQTTQESVKHVKYGNSLDNLGVPTFLLYIIITLVCFFVILFGLFVGVYFYRHCINYSRTPDNKEECASNLNEGYKGLDHLESSRTIENSHDSAYLEPVFDASAHYVEIENQDDAPEPGTSCVLIHNQNEEIVKLSECPYISSPSNICLVPVVDNAIANNDDITSCTHSL